MGRVKYGYYFSQFMSDELILCIVKLLPNCECSISLKNTILYLLKTTVYKGVLTSVFLFLILTIPRSSTRCLHSLQFWCAIDQTNYRFILTNYLLALWSIFSIILLLSSGGTVKNPRKSFSIKFYYWILTGLATNDFINLYLIKAFITTHYFDIQCLLEAFLDSKTDDKRYTNAHLKISLYIRFK